MCKSGKSTSIFINGLLQLQVKNLMTEQLHWILPSIALHGIAFHLPSVNAIHSLTIINSLEFLQQATFKRWCHCFYINSLSMQLHYACVNFGYIATPLISFKFQNLVTQMLSGFKMSPIFLTLSQQLSQLRPSKVKCCNADINASIFLFQSTAHLYPTISISLQMFVYTKSMATADWLIACSNP